jgi:tetratricopeptide (TPR) repeat protein
LACDQDALRFRADSRINEMIRHAASHSNDQGVHLVDTEAVLARQSPHGIPGHEYLYEHVHLNFEGNYLVARAIAEEVARSLEMTKERPWLSAQECARRLGWNDFTRLDADRQILSRLSDSPFTEQAGHGEQYESLLRQIAELQPSLGGEVLRSDEAQTEAAAAAAPNDWVLQELLARLQQQTGDSTAAMESLQHLTRLLPQSSEAWQDLGLACETAGQPGEAMTALQQAVALSPESVLSLNSLAELFARERHFDEAQAAFRAILRKKPGWGPAHFGLGKVFEAQNDAAEADNEFRKAFDCRGKNPSFLNTLGQFSFSRGQYEAAVTNFTDALRSDPTDANTQLNLGLVLLKLDRHAEAKTHFAEAVRWQPNSAQSQFLLGMELAREGAADQAAAHFGEAVRLKPDFVEARLNLAIGLFNKRLYTQALEQFAEVLRRDPANTVARDYAKVLRASSVGR